MPQRAADAAQQSASRLYHPIQKDEHGYNIRSVQRMKLWYCPSCHKVFFFGPIALWSLVDYCPNCIDGRIYHGGKDESEARTEDIRLREVPLEEVLEIMRA